MNTSPTIDEMLEGFMIAISEELLPALSNPKAQATALMMQSLIQQLRQTLPVYDMYVADEHNAMTQVLRDIATTLDGVSGPEANRIHERAATLGKLADVPVPIDPSPVRDAHRALGFALQDTLTDLDVLQRAGETKADAALLVLRSHLGPRAIRDVATATIPGGFVGRG